ncbi:hypothetical protein ACFQ0B_59870 [Nonomuraea thailandensis]
MRGSRVVAGRLVRAAGQGVDRQYGDAGAGAQPGQQLGSVLRRQAARAGVGVSGARSTPLSVPPATACCPETTAGTMPAIAVPMNTASTSPLTDRKAAFGSAAIRCAARRVAAPPVTRAASRAASIVSHGPARISPIMMSARAAQASSASGSRPSPGTPARRTAPAR